MIHEITSQDWPAFCQLVTGRRVGAMVKLEVIESDGIKSERIANATFQDMLFERTDACSDRITLRLRDTREIVYEIIEPIQIRLHPSGTPDDFNPLQIEAESGVTFITFHPAIHAQMLEGLKINQGLATDSAAG